MGGLQLGFYGEVFLFYLSGFVEGYGRGSWNCEFDLGWMRTGVFFGRWVQGFTCLVRVLLLEMERHG